MAAARGKGTVTPLSTLFPIEEAQKASRRVKDTLLEKREELDTLNGFAADNSTLINLVQNLPDELHHHIMVPFGKAAFFPGRLVHTNEFLVLLGERYFAERTAKQTVDILERRGKMLDSQVDSVKAVIQDLKAEASFFDTTIAEATEGLVEIKEYVDDEDSGRSPETADVPCVSGVSNGGGAGVVDDEEYGHIMARLDELEKKELEEEEPEELRDDAPDNNFSTLDQEKSEGYNHIKKLSDDLSQSNYTSTLHHETLNLLPGDKDESSHGEDILQTFAEISAEEDYVHSVAKLSAVSKSKAEVSVPARNADASNQFTRPATDSLKAFTGSIIERTDNLPFLLEKEPTNQPSNSQPSKPVSRFKQRRAC